MPKGKKKYKRIIEAPVGELVLPTGATVLDYALATNPDEDWTTCCVCGCAGDCASYDRLVRGLLLLADGTLGRAAWCFTLRCAGERCSSTYIPAPSGD